MKEILKSTHKQWEIHRLPFPHGKVAIDQWQTGDYNYYVIKARLHIL